MEKKKRILILAREWKEYQKILSEYGYVIEIATSESDLFEKIRGINCDVVIIECERPVGGILGTNIIEYTAMLRSGNLPRIIAVTKMSTPQAKEYYSTFPADEVLFFTDTEKDLVNAIRRTLSRPKDSLPERKRRRTVKEITALLEEEGLKESNIGTVYLAEAITDVIYRPESIKLLTKTVYPDIAERYSTTAAAVERSIRFVVDKVSDEPNSHYIQYWVTRLKTRIFPYF